MGKSLHGLIENYADITPKLRGQNATQAARKLAAALRAAASFGRQGCRVFPRNFGVIFNQIVQRFVHPQY